MKVLLATDGSAGAEVALDLTGGLSWSADTVVRVIAVTPDDGTDFGMAVPSLGTPVEGEAPVDPRQHMAEIAEQAVTRLQHAGLKAEKKVASGRVASVIVAEAEEWPADLLIVGSRGHGNIVSMLLGSVSAEIVDHAPCPVLVARLDRLQRLVLAHDGSEHGRAAEEIVASWPIFANVAAEVVGVVPLTLVWQTGLAAIGPPPEMMQQTIDAQREEHQRIVADAEQRLTIAGRAVTGTVLHGPPAAEIIRAAEDRRAELIVLGTRGRTGISRLLLGSVARNVLFHAAVSVLVVRGTSEATRQ